MLIVEQKRKCLYKMLSGLLTPGRLRVLTESGMKGLLVDYVFTRDDPWVGGQTGDPTPMSTLLPRRLGVGLAETQRKREKSETP